MAGLVNGKWVASTPAAEEIKQGGQFVRAESAFRHAISADPAGRFPAERGRYLLFAAYSCPWASRVIAYRVLKGLEQLIPVVIAEPILGAQGWLFHDGPDGPEPDGYPLHRLYTTADPAYTGKVSVPTLWDRQARTIVNNESAEIIRFLNTAFDGLTGSRDDLYPEPLRAEIDEWNAAIYPAVNNGVYRAGFATSQAAYDEAVFALFAMLDRLEDHLSASRYLAGEYCTEADWRLFTTLVRFDVAYHGAFKCNLRRIADYPALSAYLRELYQWPGIAATVKFDHIKTGYYSIRTINPHGIVPAGPPIDLTAPHGRDWLPGAGIWQRD